MEKEITDHTNWTWFDYHLLFEPKNQQYNNTTEEEDRANHAVAVRLERLGIPFNRARFICFPPQGVGAYLMRTCVNFARKEHTTDIIENLVSEGMNLEDAIAWAELYVPLDIGRVRELIAAGDIDPVKLREMFWEKRWDFEFALKVYRNDIDPEIADTMYVEPEMKSFQMYVSDGELELVEITAKA